MLNKDIENIKKTQFKLLDIELQWKILNEIKTAESKISELEDVAIETIHNETQKETEKTQNQWTVGSPPMA